MLNVLRKLWWSGAALVLATSVVPAQQYSVATVAGGSAPVTPVAASSLSIGQPRRVAVDRAGNLFFSTRHLVYKVTPAGNLTVLAGNSRPGFSGDGGPAVNAQLSTPMGIGVDAAGNVYIADSGNNRVRIVTPDGIIHTFAGDGNIGSYGDYGDTGPARDAHLQRPSGIAVSSTGVVYIADTGHNRISKVTADGVIHGVAGDGFASYAGDGGDARKAEFHSPQDVAVDPSGDVFIADTGNGVIRKVNSEGIVDRFAGDGSVASTGDGGVAVKAGLFEPWALAAPGGALYVVEAGGARIRKIDDKNTISTFAGTGVPGFAGDGGQASSAQFNVPTGIAVDGSGNVYLADAMNGRIRKIAGGGAVSTVAGNGVYSYSGNGGPALNAQMNTPSGVASGAAGNVYFSEAGNHVVRMIGPDGNVTVVAGNASAGFAGDNGNALNAQLNTPQGIAVDQSGNLYIADSVNNRVRKVSAGVITSVAGTGAAGFGGDGGAATGAQLRSPYGVAVDTTGNLYIAEFGNNRVRKVAADGKISTVAGNGTAGFAGDGGPAAGAQLNGPKSVAVDRAGNLYIADTNNNRVRLVTTDGTIRTLAGNGLAGFAGDFGPATLAQVGNPTGLAIDAAGNVFVTDGSSRVRRIYPNGYIQTVAGMAARGYSGDGGLATSAQLNAPAGISAAASGALYVSDAGNNVVRMLQPVSSSMAIAAVTNGASNLIAPVAPGEVLVIYGSGLGPNTLVTAQLDSTGRISRTLAGTSVVINGSMAPVLYTSATQVAAVAPFSVAGSAAEVFVQYAGQSTLPFSAPAAPVAPGVFTLDATGKGQAAAINQFGDYAVNGPSAPAKAGDYVALYITGAGQTNPPGVDGELGAVPLPLPASEVKVTVGGKSASTNYAGGAVGMVAGTMQVNVRIPEGVAPGDAPVVVTVDGVPSQTGVTLRVQ